MTTPDSAPDSAPDPVAPAPAPSPEPAPQPTMLQEIKDDLKAIYAKLEAFEHEAGAEIKNLVEALVAKVEKL